MIWFLKPIAYFSPFLRSISGKKFYAISPLVGVLTVPRTIYKMVGENTEHREIVDSWQWITVISNTRVVLFHFQTFGCVEKSVEINLSSILLEANSSGKVYFTQSCISSGLASVSPLVGVLTVPRTIYKMVGENTNHRETRKNHEI